MYRIDLSSYFKGFLPLHLMLLLVIGGVGPACTNGTAPPSQIHETSPERERLGVADPVLDTLAVNESNEIYKQDEVTEPGELEALIKEALSSEKVLDLENARSDVFRSRLNLINRSLLALIDAEKYAELQGLIPHYMASIQSNCEIEKRDCELLIIYKQDHFSHKVFFEIARLAQAQKIQVSPHWSRYALMSYITQVGDLSRELQEFFILHSAELKTELFSGDPYLQSVFFRALTVITQTIGSEDTEAIERLAREFKPWLYRTDDLSEMNRIRRILWPLWAQAGTLPQNLIESDFMGDSKSMAHLTKIIPDYSYTFFNLEPIQNYDLCLFSLDRIYRGLLEYSDLDQLWSRAGSDEKAQCLDQVDNYLSQRLIVESLQSAEKLLEILTYVKTQASSSSFLKELQNKLRPTKDSIVSLRESFGRVQTFSFRILLPPSVTRYDEIEKRFLSLSKNLKMFIEYPAIMGALYHLKDIKQTSLNANFQLIEVNAEKLLTEFIQGFGMPIFELGLDEGAYRYPSQLEFMHSFSFGLGTGFFQKLEIADDEIYKFVVNHYAINQLKYFEDQLQFFKDSNSSHKYYSLAPFCRPEYDAFVAGREVEASDYLIYLSSIDTHTYTESNNGLLVFNPFQQKFNEFLSYLRIDAAKYIQFRRFLRNQLSQVAQVKSTSLGTDSEMGVNEEIYRIHKEAVNFVHDVTVNSFECYSAIQNIEVKRRLHIMWFEYLHFAEIHKAMTEMASGASYDGFKDYDRLGLAPHLNEFTQNIHPDRYRLSLLEMSLRYAHYMTEGSELAAKQLGQTGSYQIKPRAKIEYNLNRFSESEKKRHQWIPYHPDVDVFIERAFNSSFTKIQRTQDMVTWAFKLPSESNLFYLMKTFYELYMTSNYFNSEELFYKNSSEKLSEVSLEELFEKISVIYNIYSLDNVLPKEEGVPSEEKLLDLAKMPHFFEDFRDNITRYHTTLAENPLLDNGITSFLIKYDGLTRYPYEYLFSTLMDESDENPLWIVLLNLTDAPQVKSPEGLGEVEAYYRSIVQMDGLFIPLNEKFEEMMTGFYNRLSAHRLDLVQETFCYARQKSLVDYSFFNQSRTDLRISLLDDIHTMPAEDIDPEQLGILRGWSAEFYRISKGFLVTEPAINKYMLPEKPEYPTCQ